MLLGAFLAAGMPLETLEAELLGKYGTKTVTSN